MFPLCKAVIIKGQYLRLFPIMDEEEIVEVVVL